MIALGEHLGETKNVSLYLKKVHQHEKDRIVRLSHQLREGITKEDSLEIEEEDQETFSKDKIKKYIIINRKKHWQEKQTHGYRNNKLTKNEEVNIEEAYSWIRSENLSSHVEGYIFSLQEQEVNTQMAPRLSHQLREGITKEDSLEIEEEDQETFSKDKIKKYIIINRKKHWQEKQTHGYQNNKLTKNEEVNIEETYSWIRSENVEGYIFSLQEQKSTPGWHRSNARRILLRKLVASPRLSPGLEQSREGYRKHH